MRAAVFALAAAIGGCGHNGTFTATRTGPTYPAKASGCRVKVYDDKADVKRPYEPVCLIDARTGETLFDDRTVTGALEYAKQGACKCGADAIILRDTAEDGPGLVGWGKGRVIVKAIRYLREGEAGEETIAVP